MLGFDSEKVERSILALDARSAIPPNRTILRRPPVRVVDVVGHFSRRKGRPLWLAWTQRLRVIFILDRRQRRLTRNRRITARYGSPTVEAASLAFPTPRIRAHEPVVSHVTASFLPEVVG